MLCMVTLSFKRKKNSQNFLKWKKKKVDEHETALTIEITKN